MLLQEKNREGLQPICVHDRNVMILGTSHKDTADTGMGIWGVPYMGPEVIHGSTSWVALETLGTIRLATPELRWDASWSDEGPTWCFIPVSIPL